jgi:hypothetical protein
MEAILAGRSTALARRSTKAKAQLTAARKRASALTKEYKSTGFALGNGAMFLGGAAAAGATRAYMPYLGGSMPSDVAVGLVLAGAGAATKNPKLIYTSMGFLSGWVSGYAQEATEKYLYGTGSIAVPESATGGQ